ncbi:MAG: trehalose-6-phosphate synthase [Deltaproteobacteria bacterium]|nr:trehalose-6-phosphate synthase [Deltaproteobacteria bacterium]
MWTTQRLQRFIQTKLGDIRLVIVANRETYSHHYQGERIIVQRPPGGLVAAIDPILRCCHGTLVAHGHGDADRVVSDGQDRVHVPPEDPQYTIRRIWLTPEEMRGYYDGFSNDALWPLCHLAYTRPQFSAEAWEAYQRVNHRFAETVLDELGTEPGLVWLQDYHLALVPAMLKARRPDVLVAHFWHIPWPSYDNFRICPWRQEILWGLLGNDLLGFHIQQHGDHFLDCCDRELEIRIDRERNSVFHHGGIETMVRPLPIGIDACTIAVTAAAPESAAAREQWRGVLGISPAMKILLGVDRLDYTKGIPERLRAFSLMLEQHPEWKERAVFVQLGATTRAHIEAYRLLSEEVEGLVGEINAQYGTDRWQPIRLIRHNVSTDDLVPLYQIADVCVVTSLHDGMNLVAKEFVAAQAECRGMLVLSRFAGAAQELPEAILVNPFSDEHCAEAFHRALTMPEEDRLLRMEQMHETVMEQNIFRWASRSIAVMARLV